MKSIITSFILSITVISVTLGQSNVLFKNAKKYDTERYIDINGTPYLWKEPKTVTIYPYSGKPLENLSANYNLTEGEIEVYDQNMYVVLREVEYPKVTYTDKDGNTTTLVSNIHPSKKGKYYIEHYKDEYFGLYENKEKPFSSVVVQTPGKTETIDKFKNSKSFFIVASDEVVSIGLKKKKIIKKFGHKKEINSFVKQNKLKLKNIPDLIELLKFINENGWLIK